MKVMTVYTAYETTNEYGNLGRLIGICKDKSQAETIAERQGWYGSNGRVIEGKAIVDCLENVYLLANEGNPTAFYDDVERKRKEREQMREKAIAKLTEEELALILEGVKK